MAFAGDLNKLALGDILQTLAMTRQAGELVIRGREERRIAFSERGMAVLSQRPSLGDWLGRYLVGVGALSPEALEQALKTQRRERGRFLGDIIEELGVCSPEEMLAARRYIAQEELFELFEWRQGEFAFEPGEPSGAQDGPFANLVFDVGGVAMEAARRMDETQLIGDLVPLTEVFITAEGVTGPPDPAQVGGNAARTFHLLDGSRTLEMVLAKTHLGRFDTLKATATLVQAGYVRAAGVGELVQAAEQALAQKSFDRAAQLFEVASLRDPNADQLLERAAEALTKAGQKRAAAEQLVRLGDYRLAAGDPDGAEATFRRAVKLDHDNPRAHAGLMQAQLDRCDVEAGVESARAAASSFLAADRPAEARQIAEIGLEHSPGDILLRLSLASAHLDEGDQAAAMDRLDELVSILESTGENDRRLAEVYRKILQIAPDRKDVSKRLEEIAVRAQAARRKLAQRALVAAGIVILAAIAVPLMQGPGVDGQLSQLNTLIRERDEQAARALILQLQDMSLDVDQQIELTNLVSELDRTRTRPADMGPVRELESALNPIYAKAATSIDTGAHERGLAALLEAGELVNQDAYRKLGQEARAALNELKGDYAKEVHTSLGTVARAVGAHSRTVAAATDRFTPETMRKSDLAQMQTLVEVYDQVREVVEGQDWKKVVASTQELVKFAGPPKDNSHVEIEETVGRMLEDYRRVAEEGPRALASVRKARIESRFHEARRQAKDLANLGELEKSAELFREFLALCDELATYEPDEIYRPLREQYLKSLDVDGRMRARLNALESIFERELSAARALAGEDYVKAWNLRSDLVRDNPDIQFGTRFQLPLRIESRPPGAEVLLLTPDDSEVRLGNAPLVVNCQLAGRTRVVVRLPGFAEQLVSRDGAGDQRGGLEFVNLLKEARTTSVPTRPHITQSPVAGGDGVLYTASRDGVVRSISGETGAEIARFETGRLDGIAGAPLRVRGRIHVATLDGMAFVLDEKTLQPVRGFPLDGACSASPAPTGDGAIYADAGGFMRRVDADGREMWKSEIGRVKTDVYVEGDRVFATTIEGELVVVDIADGGVETRIRLSGNPLWGPPLVHEKRAYIGCDDQTAACVSLADGGILWRTRLDGPIRGRPALLRDRVVFATGAGSVHVLSTVDGVVQKRFVLGAPVRTDVLGLADGFAVATEGGIVSRFSDPAELLWRFDTADAVNAGPRLVDGDLVVVTRSGSVFVLSP